MPDQPITPRLEISSEIAQQDVWNLEEQLSQIRALHYYPNQGSYHRKASADGHYCWWIQYST